MNITMKGRNIEITSALKDRTEKKLGRLERIMDIKDVSITMSVERNLHKIEVTMVLNGYILRGEETSDDMYTSIDLVTDKMEKQLVKYKEKIQRKNKKQKAQINAMTIDADLDAALDAEDGDVPVRIKRFAVKPMMMEEAIMQMNLLGHSFFVYIDSETENVNVVYVRRDGKYGLLEPEY